MTFTNDFLQRGAERTAQQGLPGEVSGSGVKGCAVGTKVLWQQLIKETRLNTETRPEYSCQAGRIQGGQGTRLGTGRDVRMAWIPFQHRDGYKCHTFPLHPHYSGPPRYFWYLCPTETTGTEEGIDRRKMKQRSNVRERRLQNLRA